jgi:exonuclease SbcC
MRGFSEEELASILEDAVEIYDLPRNQTIKSTVVTECLEKEKKACEAFVKRQKELLAANKQAKVEIYEMLKRSMGSGEMKKPDVELQRRMDAIQNAITMPKLAKDCLTVSPNDEFRSIYDALKLLSGAVYRIREAFKQIEEKDALESKWAESLKRVKESITEYTLRSERVKKALVVLGRLLNSDNKTSYLSAMLKDQREKLASLFRQIHAPQEFEEVKLNGDIFLSRRGGGTANLTQISTGQRSALALSIFLSMNSSVGKKAPWLIFDDPIVHIDDLNVLSFLDSLRELVTTGKRQMFFATANSKVANLFVRKFDFLGDSFKEFVLERSGD